MVRISWLNLPIGVDIVASCGSSKIFRMTSVPILICMPSFIVSTTILIQKGARRPTTFNAATRPTASHWPLVSLASSSPSAMTYASTTKESDVTTCTRSSAAYLGANGHQKPSHWTTWPRISPSSAKNLNSGLASGAACAAAAFSAAPDPADFPPASDLAGPAAGASAVASASGSSFCSSFVPSSSSSSSTSASRTDAICVQLVCTSCSALFSA
mmetsp:Transcript_822/g.2412  ORF Transcript_822/g.2412 Transcript_822/m.2412 type:complete len:214 (-) Transcript_822:122-763(-)